MKRISFDFDYTLSRKSVQKTAKELILLKYEVHIVTSRYEDTTKYNDPKIIINANRDLYFVAAHLGIDRKHIHFTNMTNKHLFFLKPENQNFIFHLDDDDSEIELINKHTPVIGIVCDNINNWKLEIEKLCIT